MTRIQVHKSSALNLPTQISISVIERSKGEEMPTLDAGRLFQPLLVYLVVVVAIDCVSGDDDNLKSEGGAQDWLSDKLGSSRSGSVSGDFIGKLMSDELSDLDLHLSSVQQIERTGFRTECYDSQSKDGYVTQLIRIVNPLARPQSIRGPPIVLYGGQTISPAAFLYGTGSRHHPTHWPPVDWSPKSGKRSLALLLSNSGYDVWLVAARGVDAANRRRVGSIEDEEGRGSMSKFATKLLQIGDLGNRTLDDYFTSFTRQLTAKDYWSFSNDEIIAHEFRAQLELIISISGEQKLSLVTYANGGLIGLGMLAENYEFAEEHIDAFVALAPAVYLNKLNLSFRLKVLLEPINHLPLVGEFNFGGLAKKTALNLCGSKQIRYTICKLILDALYGQSGLFRTSLGLSVINQFIVPTSAKSLQQMMQIADCNEFRHFDNGLLENHLIYGELVPPIYDLKKVRLEKMFVFWGGQDAIVDRKAIDRLEEKLGVKFRGRTEIRGYNHIDLLAAWDVDQEVNELILQTFDELYPWENKNGIGLQQAKGEGASLDKQQVVYKVNKSTLVKKEIIEIKEREKISSVNNSNSTTT